MSKHKEKKKENNQKTPKKDSMEQHGELLYKKNKEDIDADEVFHDPKVPGMYAGDC